MKEFRIKNEQLAIKLMSRLKNKGFTKDEIIGVMLHAKSENNWEKILEEIDKHPDFTQKRWLLYALALGETVEE